MLIGGNFSPYRTPAGNVPFYCASFAHASGDVLADIYANTTTVPNPAGGANIAPYERFVDLSASTGCDQNSNCPGGVCNPWIGGSTTPVQYTLVAAQATTAPQSFTKGAQVNFAVCHKTGFKRVVARRQWHGMFGFLTEGQTDTVAVCSDGSTNAYESYKSAPDGTKFLTIKKTASRTANLQGATDNSYDGEATYQMSVNPQSGERTRDTCTRSETYGSANTTPPGCETIYTNQANLQGSALYDSSVSMDAALLAVPTTLATMSENFMDFLTPKYSDDTFTRDGTGGTLHCGPSRAADFDTSPPGGGPAVGDVIEQYTRDMAGGSFSRTIMGLGVTVGVSNQTWKQILSESAGVTSTKVTYTNQCSENYNNEDECVVKTSVEFDLSNSNPAASIYADLKSLLSYWPLDDDELYPWRTDGFTNVAVKMSRLEVQENVSPDGTFDCTGAFVDSNVYSNGVKLFDGSIQGAPNPAGYQGYYRFDALDKRGCCDGSVFTLYTYGYMSDVVGFNSYTGAQLPLNATQWTDLFEIINHPSIGAFIAYADQSAIPGPPSCAYSGGGDGSFFAAKWAECGETYQSCNFARPGGADKFLLDETQPVYCCDGTTITDSTSGSPVASVTLTGPWGGPSVNGWFNGATTDGSGVLTLGAQLFSVPSDWHSASGDDGTAFGKLRFSTAPSLLGRIPITPVNDANGNAPFSHAGDPGQLPGGSPVDWIPTCQFGTPQTSFGMAWIAGAHPAAESLDLWTDAMTSVASNIAATRLSDTQFTTTTAYSTATFVTIHGAPAYQYCDNYPKGDYIYLEWLHDFRTNGENARLNTTVDCSGSPVTFPAANYGYASFSQTQDALPNLKCHPRVVCFSPNGEDFENGNTYDFPSTFVADERYGAKWQAQVLWSMSDPLWQTPHLPCGATDPLTDTDYGAGQIAWGIDDGSCKPNVVDGDTGLFDMFYGLPPMFEARLTVPSGFPALPSGVALGFLSPVTNNTGDVAYPPGPAGYGDDLKPAGAATPWGLAATICANLTGCRFNYAAWMVGCPPASP